MLMYRLHLTCKSPFMQPTKTCVLTSAPGVRTQPQPSIHRTIRVQATAANRASAHAGLKCDLDPSAIVTYIEIGAGMKVKRP